MFIINANIIKIKLNCNLKNFKFFLKIKQHILFDKLFVKKQTTKFSKTLPDDVKTFLENTISIKI